MQLTTIPLALAFVVLQALPAFAAEPAANAEQLIGRGVELRRKGQHDAALALFLEAHRLAPSSRTIGQIGLAEISLRRWVDAETHLSAALAAHDTAWIDDPAVRKALEKALAAAQGHIAAITIVGTPGATLAVDGQILGQLPRTEPVRVSADKSPVLVRAEAPNYQPREIPVPVRGGSDFRVQLDLVPMLDLDPGTVPPVETGHHPVNVVVQPPPHPDESAAASKGWKRWTGAALVGLGAAAVTTGIVWIAIDGNSHGDTGCAAPAGARCLPRVYNTSTQGWISLGVGVAAAAGGGVLLWQSRASADRVTIAPTGPTTMMATLTF